MGNNDENEVSGRKRIHEASTSPSSKRIKTEKRWTIKVCIH